MRQRLEHLYETFCREFGPLPREELVTARAPGRVNLIGEHTDYNGGYVLPVAIDRDILITGQKRQGRTVRAYAADIPDSVTFSLDDLQKTSTHQWSNYIKGVLLYLLEKTDHNQQDTTSGMDIVVSGNVPQGAGLSSSAAFEMAVATFAQHIWTLPVKLLDTIQLCQKAENRFVGVNCGIMDQFISAAGKKDHALFLDCLNLTYRHVPLPTAGFRVVVANTGVQRGLVDSAYNERRSQCEEGVRILKNELPHITCLRDVDSQQLEKYYNLLPPVVGKRCKHVIKENERVLDSVNALKRKDFNRFGTLMNESHESLRHLYEVSCAELDTMVEISRSLDGVLGSRMTGAGFGGCTVSLVQTNSVPSFVEGLTAEYERRTHMHAEVYVCTAEDGANIL